jgi:hypothetical protein
MHPLFAQLNYVPCFYHISGTAGRWTSRMRAGFLLRVA